MTERQPAVTVVACGHTVIVAKAGQDPMATSVDAWRQFVAEVKAGRWENLAQGAGIETGDLPDPSRWPV